MGNCDSQVILYAKNWFKKTDVMEDLRKIYAKRNGMRFEHINNDDIYEMLTKLFYDICLKENSEYSFNHLMKEIFRFVNKGCSYSETTNMKHVIKYYLVMISNAQVREIKKGKTLKILIELDEPDYSILPKC